MNPLELLSRMTALDALLVVMWVAAVAFGWNSGILRQLFLLGSVLAAGIVASQVVYGASFLLGVISGAGRERMMPFTYTVLILLVTSVVFLLTVRSYPHTRLIRHKRPDQVVGAMLGFIVGLVAINLVAAILFMTTSEPWLLLDGARLNIRQQLDSTPFIPLVAGTFPQITTIVRNLLPV